MTLSGGPPSPGTPGSPSRLIGRPSTSKCENGSLYAFEIRGRLGGLKEEGHFSEKFPFKILVPKSSWPRYTVSTICFISIKGS